MLGVFEGNGEVIVCEIDEKGCPITDAFDIPLYGKKRERKDYDFCTMTNSVLIRSKNKVFEMKKE